MRTNLYAHDYLDTLLVEISSSCESLRRVDSRLVGHLNIENTYALRKLEHLSGVVCTISDHASTIKTASEKVAIALGCLRSNKACLLGKTVDYKVIILEGVVKPYQSKVDEWIVRTEENSEYEKEYREVLRISSYEQAAEMFYSQDLVKPEFPNLDPEVVLKEWHCYSSGGDRAHYKYGALWCTVESKESAVLTAWYD